MAKLRGYGAKTRVPVDRTRVEIEALVKKYGASGFVAGWQEGKARIEFLAQNRHVRFTMEVPAQPQAERQKWRALLLLVKAKLESIDAKIQTFEQAFIGDIVMPTTGHTIYETVREPLRLAYEGKDTALLGTSE